MSFLKASLNHLYFNIKIIIFAGFASQYPDFNALKEVYDGDFEIIAVPSSNFFNVSS